MDIRQIDQTCDIGCTIHQNKTVQFIQINKIPNNDKNVFYCNFCLDEDEDFDVQNYICADKVLEQNDNQIIEKWPLFSDDTLLKKIQECIDKSNNASSLSTKIDTYFENLKSEMNNQIEQMKKKMITQSQQFPNYSDNIFEKYAEFSQINTFKQILKDSKMDNKQKQIKYKEFLQNIESQKENNTKVLQSLTQKSKQNSDLIDFDAPDKLKSSIMQLINKINFFPFDNVISDQQNNESKENNQKNTQLIIDLISTKSNYCSEKFLDTIRSSFKQISSFLEKINFEEVFIQDKKPIDFANINDKYLDLISDFSQYFTKISQDSENQIKQMKNNEKIKEIMSVLNLKSNYLKQDFQNEFQKYLIETYPLLTKLKFDTIFLENSKIQAFQYLSDEVLNNVVDLIKKIDENQKNGNNPSEQTLKIKQYCSALQKWDYLEEDLDKLYSNYPIFDLLNRHQSIDILSQMQMIKTNYNNSQQYLQIVKNQNNQISISQNTDSNNWSNCVSDFILDENTNYVFRFQFPNNSQVDKHMTIGLLRDSQKDSNYGHCDYLSCYFYINQNQFYHGGQGIDKKEKGDFSVLRQDQKEIEMRVCIKDGILQILDYPHYNHILSITDEHKPKLQQYKNLRLNISHHNKDLNLNLIYAQKRNENK